MQIVIDIPEELKQKIDEGFTSQVIINKLWDAARNGTPLPKGHGDLIDRKELLKQPMNTANYPSNYVQIAPTIVEADKEGN